MGSFTGFDPTAFLEAVEDDMVDVATGIAADVERHYPTVQVGVDDLGVHVTTYGSFDHFKEWGSVNNRPLGYMRAAAIAAGTYRPEGK